MTTTDVFKDIEREMARIRHPVLPKLMPGIDAASASNLSPVALPGEVLDLYALHDGTDCSGATLGQIRVIPEFFFPSLDKSIANYIDLTSQAGWDADWFPVLWSGSGTFYACKAEARPTSAIRRISLEDAEDDIVFESLRAMLSTVLAAYRDGLIWLDGDGAISMDWPAWFSLARRLNPHVEYWKRTSEGPLEEGPPHSGAPPEASPPG